MRRLARLALLTLSTTGAASASSVLEYPDLGATQLGRGGAWLAHASDPTAAFFNPAALARLGNAVSLSANMNMHHACFTRRKASSDTSDDGFAPGAQYPEVCVEGTPVPIPAIGAAFRLTETLVLGVAVVAPNGNPLERWPEFVGTKAGPSRYLLTSQNNALAFPTLGLGWQANDWLALGGAFTAGFARFDIETTAMAQNRDNMPTDNDVRAKVVATSLFVPGGNASFLATPLPWLDVAGWVRVSAPVNAKGDVETAANYFTPEVARGRTSGVQYGDSSKPNCGNAQLADTPCGGGDNVSVKLKLPVEAKLGFRVHRPNPKAESVAGRFDPLKDELYDLEVDLTYAQNSAIDAVEVRFPSDALGRGTVVPPGLAGGAIPPNADQEKRFRDVFGVRLGGDYALVPEELALRGGVFWESSAQSTQTQNIDFMGQTRFGLTTGATYRVPVGERGLDLSLSYMHLFVGSAVNDDPNAPGLSALAGTACNPAPAPAEYKGTCSTSGKPVYRSNWPVNLGKITNAVDALAVGAHYRW